MRARMPSSKSVAIECITFDLDDTLWACAPVIIQAERALYDWLARHYPLITARYSLEEMRRQREGLLAARAELRHDMTALRRAWITHLADDLSYPRDMVEPAVAYFRDHRNRVTLFEPAAPLLERLGQSYTVGAITNGNAQLDRIGIDHLFDFTVYSADTGAAKPEAEIFYRALALAQSQPCAAVHVGDDPANDILGAGRVGMRTIWYNPALAPWPGGRQPDAVIRSLQELEPVLTRWSHARDADARRLATLST